MINRILWLVCLSFTTIFTCGQDITRQNVDSILKVLDKNDPNIDRIDLMLTIAQFHIFKPGELQTDFDSANIYIKKAEAINNAVKSPDVRGYALLTKSFMTREKGERDEARKMTEQAISILETGKNKTYLGKAYYELSQYYTWSESNEAIYKMIALVEKSVDAFQQGGNLERKAFALTMLGDLQSLVRNNQQGIDALKRAIDAYDSIHYKKLQGVYALLGRIYTWESEHRLALQYELLALKTAEAEKDSSMQLCAINNNIGGIYNSLKQFELSIRYYKVALEIAKKYNDNYTVILLMVGIAAGYISLLQPEQAIEFLESVPKKFLYTEIDEMRVLLHIPYLRAFTNAGKLDKARIHCDSILRWVSQPDISNDTRSTVNRTVAFYFLATGNYAAARMQIAKNDTITVGLGAFRISLDQQVWYKVDSAQGRFRDAFQHLLHYKIINDSILNATKAKQLQQLEVEYETAKKQDSIKLKDQDIRLLTQNNRIQKADLKQASLIKNITIGGIILALIIIMLLYRQYRHKQQSSNLISQKNEQLQHLLTEKEWLVKEIHHRVKNNFQTVMGLLGTQSGYLKNEAAINAIKDSQHRIQSMSLIHQRLYQTENLSAINMPDYIHELTDYLADSFNSGNKIKFRLQIEPIKLDIAHCIPLGLILNEAIANSFKYAFPGDRDGAISISLGCARDNQVLLSIHDNGVGLPSSFNRMKSDSMGMNLMRGLSEEIGARFRIRNENGTLIEVGFEYNPDIAAANFPVNNKPAQVK